MDNKEKIRLYKKCVRDYEKFGEALSELPKELLAELGPYKGYRITLDYIKELQREERDKDIIKIQEQQIIFTKILALATIILAISTFSNFFDLSFVQDKFTHSFLMILGAIGGSVLIISFCILLWEMIKVFFKNVLSHNNP